MTARQKIYRKQLLAKIHQIPFVKMAKECGGWEEYLKERYGVTSSAKLSIDELNNLLDVLSGRESEARVGGSRPREGKATDRQIAALQAAWRDKAYNPTEMALREFANRVIKRRPLHLESLSKQEVSKLLIAIKKL